MTATLELPGPRTWEPDPAPSVIALVPAHNEQEQVAATLDSLLSQTVPIDKILVILDNCTDSTEQIVQGYQARHPSVGYMATVGNTFKKAGGLNQALPHCAGYDYILDTDADAIVDENFTKRSIEIMEGDPTIGALSAREGIKTYPTMTRKRGFVYRVVRYQRYLWDTFRMENPNDCMVVVGPGGMFRTSAALEVGGWDNLSLTEDNAISLDLREHGYRTVLGENCFVWSDSPLDLKELWLQRVRWSRGAEDYSHRAWSKATWKGKLLAKYQYALMAWTMFIIPFDIVHASRFKLLWLLPLLFFYADRVHRITRFFPTRRVSDYLLAMPVAEIAVLLAWQATVLTGIWQRLRKIERNW
jgi:biofilm PGA synthesis N-glycosyltransferase PgaC